MGKPEAHPTDPLCSYTKSLKEWVGGTKREASARLPTSQVNTRSIKQIGRENKEEM